MSALFPGSANSGNLPPPVVVDAARAAARDIAWIIRTAVEPAAVVDLGYALRRTTAETLMAALRQEFEPRN